jgi:hypothetical protein
MASLKTSWFDFLSTIRVCGVKKEMLIKNVITSSLWHSIQLKTINDNADNNSKLERTEKHYSGDSMVYTFMLRHFPSILS